MHVSKYLIVLALRGTVLLLGISAAVSVVIESLSAKCPRRGLFCEGLRPFANIYRIDSKGSRLLWVLRLAILRLTALVITLGSHLRRWCAR